VERVVQGRVGQGQVAAAEAAERRGGHGDAWQGETRPVAPNAGEGGGDNPEGRARNRRVEIKVRTPGPAARTALEPASTSTVLAGSGLDWSVGEVVKADGFVLAQVKVDNPTSAPVKMEYSNSFTPHEVTTGQLTLDDRAASRRHEACAFTPPRYFEFIGTMSSLFTPHRLDDIPPGATVTQWALFAAPADGTQSIDVDVAGFGGHAKPAQITP
jgi:hypothetical protein